jgi:hypothetical protein
MLTWQSIAAAVLLVYSPTILFLLFIIWRDGAFSRSLPRPEHPEILTTARKPYCRLASEIRDYASHLNDPLKNQSELASRIQFIRACRLVMTTVGFEVSAHSWAGRVIADDDDNGSEAPPIAP